MDDETLCVAPPDFSIDGFASLATPIYRASTITFPDAQSYASRLDRGDESYVYGLYGTPTSRALEKQIAALERATRTFLVPSGQAAISLAMLSVLRPGQVVLIPDSAYPPVRDFADNELTFFGIRPVYYDPTDLEALESLLDEGAAMVWTETPGSTTMEIQDIPAIVAMAHARGTIVGCDNTWATPYLFKPLDHQVDIAVVALTKYVSGHSDTLMGSISVNDAGLAARIKGTIWRMGIGVSPDECALVLRGIQTLGLRLAHSGAASLKLATWLRAQKSVKAVYHPAIAGSPGHDLWKRDFKGSSGVFTVVLHDDAAALVPQCLDAFEVISIGASWGGTRSLVAPMSIAKNRTVNPVTGPDMYLRLSIGLESEADLMADLERGFACFEHLFTSAPSAIGING